MFKYFRFHDPSWWFLLRQISDYFPVVSRKTHVLSLPSCQLPSQADQLFQILSPTGSLSDNRSFRFGVSFKVLHREQTKDQDFRHYFGTSLLMSLLTVDTRSDFWGLGIELNCFFKAVQVEHQAGSSLSSASSLTTLHDRLSQLTGHDETYRASQGDSIPHFKELQFHALRDEVPSLGHSP